MANQNLSQFTEKLFVADADHTFIWDTAASISKRVSRNSWLNSGTLTSDAPVTISQTWNAVGQTFKALVVNAAGTSGTNSASGSLVADFQVGGSSQFRVHKEGGVALNNLMAIGVISGPWFMVYNGSTPAGYAFAVNVAGRASLPNTGTLEWASFASGTPNTVLLRDGADNTLALRNGEAPQTFRLYNTYSGGGDNFERLNIQWSGGAARIFPDAGGTGTLKTVYLGSDSVANNAFLVNGASNIVQINTSGAERMRISSAGNVGIGTTSPTSKLEVAGALGVNISTFDSDAALKLTNTSGPSSWLLTSGVIGVNNSTFCIRQYGTPIAALTIMSSAFNSNVGIGVHAPTAKLHVAETWNNAGTAFCAIKSVITDTNSLAGSDFLELYSGTSTQPLRMDINKTGQINIYGTWTDASNYERLSFSAPTAGNAIIGTNKSGGSSVARGLEFQTDGVTRMTIAAGGATTFSSSVTATNIIATNYVGVPAGNGLIPNAGGSSDFIKIGSNGGSELARVGYFGTAATSYISFGGVANTSPALKRSSTTLQARLADDSAFAPIQGKLTTDTAYTATVVAATGYITIYDSTGAAYRVPCAV